MIYLIFGASCAGKSTFIKNSFVNNSLHVEEYNEICPYTVTDEAVLIGRYMNGLGAYNRTVGGDRVPRVIGSKVIDWVSLMKRKYPTKDVIIDSFRALTNKSIEDIVSKYNDVVILYITTSVLVSLKRNNDNNTTVNSSTLKAICTRGENMFQRFKDRVMDYKYIRTDNFSRSDFETFSIDKCKCSNVENAQQSYLF